MKNFTFAKKWHDILANYPKDLKYAIYIAALEYAFTGKIVEMEPLVRMAFDFIRYDIDERARDRQRRLVKKQSESISEISDKSDISDTSETSDYSENSENSDSSEEFLTDQYYRKYKAPEPYTHTDAKTPREISAGRIRSLVKMTVSDMLAKGLIKPDCPEFFIRLNQVVTRRYETLQKLIGKMRYEEVLDEKRWADLFDKVHWHNKV